MEHGTSRAANAINHPDGFGLWFLRAFGESYSVLEVPVISNSVARPLQTIC